MTVKSSEYEVKADEFLMSHYIKFKAKLHENPGCPIWCKGDCVHGDKYRITFMKAGARRLSFAFWNSLRDKQNGEAPKPYDVLAAIQKYDPGTFENFCGDFGYDNDSRTAEKTYMLVVKEWEKVCNFFTPEELEELQEVN